MPDTTYLQIQGGDAAATRVVELPGAAIRVGRGALCEIRLPDPDLAEVQCLLRRRGETWHVQPIGPAGLVSIEGEAVEQIRPLPADVPLRIGAFRLLIRSAGDRSREPIEVSRPAESTEFTSESDGRGAPSEAGQQVATVAGSAGAEEDRLRRWQGRLEQRERWLQARQEEKKWEARWRAAGEGLRARGATGQPPRAEVGPPQTTRRTGTERFVAPPVARIVPPSAKPLAAVERPMPKGISSPERSAPPLPTGGSSSPKMPGGLGDAHRDTPEEAVVAEAGSKRSSTSLRILSEGVSSLGGLTWEAPARDDKEFSPTTAAADSVGGEDAALPTSDFFDADRSGVSWHHESVRPQEAPSALSAVSGRSPSHAQEPSTDTPRAPEGEKTDFFDAATIFAAQGRRTVTRPARPATNRNRNTSRSVPTEPLEPPRWTLPAWVALSTAALGSAVLLGAGFLLAFAWTDDNLSAGLAARAAMRAESDKPVPLDPSERVETRWWKTTAGHLAIWSAAIELSPEASMRSDEVRDAIESGRRAAPVESSLRFATAHTGASADLSQASPTAGLSRDVASLTLTGRILKRSGKTATAIRAYRAALEIASEAELSRLAPPTFDDDHRVRRFRLAHEEIVAGVIRDMMAAADWGFGEWSGALPPRAIVRLTAARLLREKGNTDAERAITAVLADDIEVPASPGAAAEHHAAQAEALAFAERKAEAAARYRKAIELSEDDLTRRRNRLALAEILASLGEERERAEILEAAKGTDPTDPVSRKALEAQQFAGLK